MVGDYISREAAIKAVQNHFDDGGFDGYAEGQLMMTRICAIPAADVVEVVRCGDCIRKDICRTSNVWAVSPDDNWFCADGERKDGGQDDG